MHLNQDSTRHYKIIQNEAGLHDCILSQIQISNTSITSTQLVAVAAMQQKNFENKTSWNTW